LSLHLFELPKFERTVTTTMSETNMHEWLHFLNHAQDEVDEAARTKYTDPAIRQAFRALDRLSADAEARRLAEMREKALKDQVSALAEARDEGLREGLEKGELIGEIRLAQYQLELPLSSPEALARQTPEALQSLYHDLRQRLRQRTSRETQG
jgi:predicted transposase/invertase (TIGR01784 family)